MSLPPKPRRRTKPSARFTRFDPDVGEITLDTANGLLSPEGKLYACCYEWHDTLAYRICKDLKLNRASFCSDQDFLLMGLGWAKLQSSDNTPAGGGWEILAWSGWESAWDRLTERQRTTIFDWCMRHDVELPPELQPSKQEACPSCNLVSRRPPELQPSKQEAA